ncbi:NFX1-type zinc finger-containing protein 1 [Eumeta japonica]|uniref:NFX1-type zinc finger-containing protein 1 n=1 Tax=Eumeta variegata TaxID=151549 RepID=A0A4C1UYM2_EUMVA|nr:NFX1-type zinc finger-containing protein 1 [Eumeta japonica]
MESDSAIGKEKIQDWNSEQDRIGTHSNRNLNGRDDRIVMVEPMMSQNQFGVLVQWDTTKRKYSRNIKWEQSKRLMFGALLVFVQENFKNLIIGTVLNRDANFLSEGLVIVQLYNAQICDKKMYGASYSMLESQVYFEPYLHVLRALQDPEFSEHLAMSKYIVKIDHVPVPPSYLAKSKLILDTMNGKVKFTVLDDTTWPDHKQLGLDESQYAAYKSALTQEFVVIQGPPGTGKTYLGVLIAKTLLDNFDGSLKYSPSVINQNAEENRIGENAVDVVSSNLECRLLVLCYTNHALDQFLEYIHPVTDSIVRIGGQSRNTNLDQFNLKNKRRTESSWTLKFARSNLEDANSELSVCQKNINIFNDGVYSYDSIKTVCPEVTILNMYPGVHEDPLFNWLFEHTYYVENILSTEFIDKRVEVERHEDSEMLFSLDDVDVDEDKRLFYEDKSKIKASFLVESVRNDLKRFDEICYKENNHYNMIRNRNQFKKVHIKSRKWANQFATEERWSVYFDWAAKLKDNLLKDFPLLKEKQEKQFVAYEEARMMMDLEIVRKARVVGVTTTSAARIRKLLQALEAPIVIVEEAAEVLEAHIISALTRHCQHLILIGYVYFYIQFSKVFLVGRRSPAAAAVGSALLARHFNMEVSLFERMVGTGARAARLRLQHRMRPEIAALIAPAIYPDLQNHRSVLLFPPVRGLATNLFFFTHNNREKFEEELLSRSNHFEADMLLRLANYLMQQHYNSEDITILTTYATQMFYMRNNRSHYPYLDNVKITLVDKYQGEESKIILLSLVRNNDEGEVGFLANDNRVCVALSRAKEGLYIMGNIEMLKKKSELWTKIAATLESSGSFGTSFMLKCQQHPDNITEVVQEEGVVYGAAGTRYVPVASHPVRRCPVYLSRGTGTTGFGLPGQPSWFYVKEELTHTNIKLLYVSRGNQPLVHSPEDFLKVPEGGCLKTCDTLLKCGHRCPLMCHYYDKQHERVVCSEKCNRVCPLSHPCSQMCAEPCRPCTVLVKKELPCKHTAETYCHIQPEDVECLEEVTVKLPACGHEYECRQKCAKTKSGCTAVFMDDDEFGKHKCLKLCHEECDPCDVEVIKKIPDCGHEGKVACSITPSRKDCIQDCERTLKCGHTCNRKCTQECGCNKSTKAPKPLLCGHDIVSCEIYIKESRVAVRSAPPRPACMFRSCIQLKLITLLGSRCISVANHKTVSSQCRQYAEDMVSDDPVQLLEMCRAPCDALLACGHQCAGSCVRCRQGRLHVPCARPCRRTLICGHLCEEKCNVGCPPCDKQCEVACAHNRCPEKCGMPCVPCKEPCDRVCPHGACKRKCGAPCDRKPCDERCPLTLPCGHRCRGLCGELCPPLCAICRPDDFPTPLLGDHYEDEDVWSPSPMDTSDPRLTISVDKPMGNGGIFEGKRASAPSVTVVYGYSQPQRSHQCVAGLLGWNRISVRGGLMERVWDDGRGILYYTTTFRIQHPPHRGVPRIAYALTGRNAQRKLVLHIHILFIVLKDCGHSMGVEEADMMMQSKPDGEVHVRSCPTCRKPIVNTARYKDIVNDLFKNEINPIKTQLYGDVKQIREEHCKIGKKFLKIGGHTRVGLKLNETKTKMLVRDPINKSIAKQTQEINGVLITPVDTIKYLGTYLTSELSRRDTIKARCKQAIRNAKEQNANEKKPRMNYTNPQKRTPKALHRVKKMKNRRLTGKTNLLQISYTYKRYYNGNQEEQSKLKIRKVVDELYQLSLAPKVYLSKENEATLTMSNVETKRLRMNHTNIQKQTLKALHQAKKTENFLAKGCTNTVWLYKLPSLLIQNRIYTPPDIYAPFGVSGLVPFSHCDWLKVER